MQLYQEWIILQWIINSLVSVYNNNNNDKFLTYVSTQSFTCFFLTELIPTIIHAIGAGKLTLDKILSYQPEGRIW
jgi:hypothetical protein